MCILTEILSRAHAKGAKTKKEALMVSDFGTFIGLFPGDGAASVEGLT